MDIIKKYEGKNKDNNRKDKLNKSIIALISW